MRLPAILTSVGQRPIQFGCFAVAIILAAGSVSAHFFVEQRDRVGPSPSEAGHGWWAEVFLDIPDASAVALLNAEIYITGRTPDFTFKTTYIDFPAGPIDAKLDSEFNTMGDFLDGYVFDVSDPSKLDEPFGHFIIRFSGLLNVQLADSSFNEYGLPLLIDFATQAHGGYRTRIGTTSIYRVQNTSFVGSPFMTENAVLLGLGLFPIQITYMQQYDPTNASGNDLAGIELYSWHPGGLPWPAGAAMNDPRFGDMTVTGPHVIYQPDTIPIPANGDYNGDRRSDLLDMQMLQLCFGGEGVDVLLATGDPACLVFDYDDDADVDSTDAQLFAFSAAGPNLYPFLKGDYTTDQVVDLSDYQWLQVCFSTAPDEEERAALATGCEWMDFDNDGVIDLFDFQYFSAAMSTGN